MQMSASRLATLAAVALGAAALLLSVLSIPSTMQAEIRAASAEPATVDLSLIITGLGQAGEPAKHHFYNPQMIVARRGDRVRLRVMNMSFASHAIEVKGYSVRTGLLPGGPEGQETMSFVADKAGVFPFRCYVPHDPATGTCSPDHETMIGYFVVLDTPR